jgi:hypothetical protein
MQISARSQTAMVWWSIAFMMIFGTAWFLLIKTLPIPPATQTAAEVAAFYGEGSLRIRLGAAICSWTSAFTVPIAVVISAQMARIEKGVPVWSILQLIGGALTSLFVVIPPLLWGFAAFSPDRPAEITLTIHQAANLIFVTATQYIIFQMVSIVVVCLKRTDVAHSAFPRWYGYFTIWTAFMTEVAVAGYLTKTGPFAWNGLFVFWIPLAVGSIWLFTLAWLLLRAIKRQRADVVTG